MNNKVKFLRGTSDEYAVAEKDSDTIYFTTDDGKLYIGDKEVSGSDITIDDTLSDTSTNPVQNKAVKQAIDSKADKTVATTSADGLMSAKDKDKLDGVGDTYALKSKYGDTTIDVGRKAGSDIGERSIAEGYNTIASGSYSHAEGAGTMAYGECSHAEGSANKAIGERSHAEGLFTTAYGNYSHIEGQSISPIMSSIPNYLNDLKNMSDDEIISKWNTVEFSLAKGLYSHVEGVNSLALGNGSHAEGDSTIAKGIYSHSGGADSLAEGAESFSHGQSTKSSNQGEASFGRYNKSSSDTLFSVGDGTSDDARHNAFEITTTGGKLHDKDIATTDLIPSSLPANGGNADTLDGKHASNFIYARGYFDNIDLDDIKYPCSGLALDNCTHIPSNVWGTLLVYTGGTDSFTQIYISTEDDASPPTTMYFRHHGNTRWSDWKEISTTPIKKMTLPSVATNASGGGNLFSTDFGTPIMIACTSRSDTQCTPFFAYSDTQKLWLVLAKDCATLDPIPAGSYSFDVWYI